MLNDRSSMLSLLRTRRSSRPRDLAEPGPDAAQLRLILEIAARTPDHGKLHPWRFVHVPKDKRDAFAEMLRTAYLLQNPEPGRLEIEAVERFAHQAPDLIAVLSTPVTESKIPVREQHLSCGAACMNLIFAAHALGFSAGWVTGWAAYNDHVLHALGGNAEDTIAAFIFIGTPGCATEERPRPEWGDVVREWEGGVGLTLSPWHT